MTFPKRHFFKTQDIISLLVWLWSRVFCYQSYISTFFGSVSSLLSLNYFILVLVSSCSQFFLSLPLCFYLTLHLSSYLFPSLPSTVPPFFSFPFSFPFLSSSFSLPYFSCPILLPPLPFPILLPLLHFPFLCFTFVFPFYGINRNKEKR